MQIGETPEIRPIFRDGVASIVEGAAAAKGFERRLCDRGSTKGSCGICGMMARSPGPYPWHLRKEAKGGVSRRQPVGTANPLPGWQTPGCRRDDPLGASGCPGEMAVKTQRMIGGYRWRSTGLSSIQGGSAASGRTSWRRARAQTRQVGTDSLVEGASEGERALQDLLRFGEIAAQPVGASQLVELHLVGILDLEDTFDPPICHVVQQSQKTGMLEDAPPDGVADDDTELPVSPLECRT